MSNKFQIPHSFKRLSDAINIHLKQFESNHPDNFTYAREREGFAIEYFRFRFARRVYGWTGDGESLGFIRLRQLNTNLTEMVMEDSSRLEVGPNLFLNSDLKLWEDEEEQIRVPLKKRKAEAAAKFERFKAIHQEVREYIIEALHEDRLLEVDDKSKSQRTPSERTPTANIHTRVFISYAHEDIESALKMYEQLNAIEGVDPWFDKENLLPGMKWRPAIKKAIRESDFFLALLSKRSTAKRGYVQKEMKEALEIWDQFPEGKAFMIPIRLEPCQPSYEKLSEVQIQDFFPSWDRGFQKVLQVISSSTHVDKTEDTFPTSGYEYRCAIVDFDNGLTNLSQICQRLNSIQSFFHFSFPTTPDRFYEIRDFEGQQNLYVPGLPKSFFRQKNLLNADLVACLTRYLLAFKEGRESGHNFLSLPSDVDDTFLFISTHGLYEMTKKARCTFEKGIVYHILTQLLIHFASGLGFHEELRGCLLDYCEEHAWQIKGLKKMTLCSECTIGIENQDLKKAVLAILADPLKV